MPRIHSLKAVCLRPRSTFSFIEDASSLLLEKENKYENVSIEGIKNRTTLQPQGVSKITHQNLSGITNVRVHGISVTAQMYSSNNFLHYTVSVPRDLIRKSI